MTALREPRPTSVWGRRGPSRGLAALMMGIVLSACQPEAEATAPEVRPVRTVTLVKRDVGETVTYTGRIQAENETRQSFRIAGRMIERSVNVGDRVDPGQVVAKLEPQDELNALRSAQAAVSAAEAKLVQYNSTFDRQRVLLERQAASRAVFEQAEQALALGGAQAEHDELVLGEALAALGQREQAVTALEAFLSK